MLNETFLDAHLPEPFRILGLTLKPFSLGHITILKRIESPYITGEASEFLPADLTAAVLICAHDWEGGKALLNQRNLAFEVFKWMRRLNRPHSLWKRLFGPREKIDWPEKAKLFQRYLEQGLDTPEYSYDAERSRGVNAPVEHQVRVALMAGMHLSEDEVMNRPWRLSMSDFLLLRALDGQIDFVDSSELRAAQEKANAIAEKLKQRSANGKESPKCPS